MAIVATIEARMTSSRLPGKVLMQAGGEPMLGILIRRLQSVREIDKIVVATTVNAADDPVVETARSYGADAFRGSELDVLGRVAEALKVANAVTAVQITGDCPLIDPAIVSSMIATYKGIEKHHHYVSNTKGPVRGAPYGQDVQIFPAALLQQMAGETQRPEDREHVSFFFYQPENAERFRPYFVQQFPEDLAKRFWVTLDYEEDYRLLKAAHEAMAPDVLFGADRLVAFCERHPALSLPCLERRGLDADGAPLARL